MQSESVHITEFKEAIIAIQNELDFEVHCWTAVESVFLLVTPLTHSRTDVFSGRHHHTPSRFGDIEFSFIRQIEAGVGEGRGKPGFLACLQSSIKRDSCWASAL